jgi:2-isopropylmalate synthase
MKEMIFCIVTVLLLLINPVTSLRLNQPYHTLSSRPARDYGNTCSSIIAKNRQSVRRYSVATIDIYGEVITPLKVTPTAHDKYTGRDPARVKIFDTTLRDGEQSPGCTMNIEEKINVAKQLAKLGVDIIEAGFPVSSLGDFEAVSRIAATIGQSEDPPIICGLARSLKNDIKVCYDAIKVAKFPRIHLFIATSDIHMEYKLKKNREQVLDITTEMVTYAKSLCDDIEFSAEDALRSDPEFLYQVYSRAIAAGATTINVPDTVGYTTPGEFRTLVAGLRKNVAGIDDIVISVHGHNDLGMAVANFHAAIEAGARQLECTINGIGERAGNAALEELVMGLHVRKAYYNRFFERSDDCADPLTNINTQEIYKTSRLVSSITGMLVQANKAIVGANAFAHESGIHQDGVLKNKRTYEIMDAESIGLSENSIVLGKHSGRAAFRSRLQELGYTLTDVELNSAFVRFKELADKKKDIENADIESIVNDEMALISGQSSDKKQRYKLDRVQVSCGDGLVSTATICLIDELNNGKVLLTSDTGTGPVDAAYRAISQLTSDSISASDLRLLEYTVSSVTAGIDALGEVTVRIQDLSNSRIAIGRAANTDVIVASAQAYLHAINRVISLRGEELPKHPQFSTAVY